MSSYLMQPFLRCVQKHQIASQKVWAILRLTYIPLSVTHNINTVKVLKIPAVLLNFVQPIKKKTYFFFNNLIPLNICGAYTDDFQSMFCKLLLGFMRKL